MPLISRPDLWPTNQEIDFGGGLYGYRKAGTITANANAMNHVNLSVGVTNIISCGGYVKLGAGNTKFFIGTSISDFGYATVYFDDTTNMYLFSGSVAQRINAPYDVWALYTK